MLRFPASLGATEAIEAAEAAQDLLENTPPEDITELLTEGKYNGNTSYLLSIMKLNNIY